MTNVRTIELYSMFANTPWVKTIPAGFMIHEAKVALPESLLPLIREFFLFMVRANATAPGE